MTAPDRMPSRTDLAAPLPLDVAALVAAGHLLEVAPNVYRRAPRTPDTAPTVRELLDHCTDRIATALLTGDADTARTFHAAARFLHASVGAGDNEPDWMTTKDLDPHEHTTATSASGQQPTPHLQDAQATRPPQTAYGTAGVSTPAAQPRPSARRTGAAVSVQQTTPAGISREAVPHGDRRCSLLPPPFFGFGHGSAPPPCPAGVVEIPYTAGDLVAVRIVHPFGAGVKRPARQDRSCGLASTPPRPARMGPGRGPMAERARRPSRRAAMSASANRRNPQLPNPTERTAMSEHPDTEPDLTEESAAEEAARLRDPARHAIANRSSGQTGRDLTARLVARYSTAASDDTPGGAA